jgi:hypothetical protein
MLTERREREIGRYIDKIWNREKNERERYRSSKYKHTYSFRTT